MLRHFSRKAMDAWVGTTAVKNQVQSLAKSSAEAWRESKRRAWMFGDNA
jgi:hypothetical protein